MDGAFPLDLANAQTTDELAHVLRWLRRREARHREGAELTYRELASQAGWAHATVYAYLTGKSLPPTDRFDALIQLLGAAPSEQSALATARDRVEELRRTPILATSPPRQLPMDIPGFVGRTAELAELDRLLAPAEQPPAVPVVAVTGTAGVGKTALTLHWTHRVAERFPDGQLYVNLRGYAPEQPLAPTDALARLLTALGMVGRSIPPELDDRAARYRSELAGRRMLIVLDNAASTAQVRPLLPGSGSCLVVVTSRDSLASLVAVHGTHRLHLDLLAAAEAVQLLRQLIGPRVDAEREVAATLAEQCVRLPLALRVAAELAASRPESSLADLVADLADRQRRLELLNPAGDPYAAVREVFSWSIQHLPGPAAHLFRRLGLHPGPDLDPHAAAALAGTCPDQTRRSLLLLTRAHLVHRTGRGRYGMHELLHAYATGLAATEGADR